MRSLYTLFSIGAILPNCGVVFCILCMPKVVSDVQVHAGVFVC